MTTKDARPAPAFKVRPNALAETDDAAMYALFVASVPEVDREGELILPQDFVTAEWEANPIWLWAHDQKQLPIGAGYQPDGRVACFQSNDALRLGCRFSQANPQGALTYALYKEKTLKMVSVGFISGGARRLDKFDAAEYGHDGPAVRILAPELVECSCVPVGMNRRAMLQSLKSWDGYADREAVASILDRGHLHGEKVSAAMREVLQDFAAPRPAWTTKGFVSGKIPNSPSEFRPTFLPFKQGLKGNDMAKSTVAKPPLSAGTIPGKTDGTATEASGAVATETKAALAVTHPDGTAETKAVEVAAPTATKDMGTTADAQGGTAVPMGVDALTGGMAHMLAFCKAMSEAMAPSDLSENRDYAKSLCAKAAELVGDMGEYGTKTFPDHTDLFTSAMEEAANFAVLDEEPDAADAGTEQEAELLDEVAGEKAADDEAKDEPKDDEKSAEPVVTTKDFNEWYAKAFGEVDVKEAVQAWVKEAVADELAAVKGQVAEHHAALEDMETVLTGRRT